MIGLIVSYTYICTGIFLHCVKICRCIFAICVIMNNMPFSGWITMSHPYPLCNNAPDFACVSHLHFHALIIKGKNS